MTVEELKEEKSRAEIALDILIVNGLCLFLAFFWGSEIENALQLWEKEPK